MKTLFLVIPLLYIFISKAFSYESFCISHRGNGGGHLENSLSALKSAIDLGSHGIEFDIVHTIDREPILMHDSTLWRTARSKKGKKCPRQTKVKNIFLKKIKSNCKLKNGDEVPHLEDALIKFSNEPKFFLIELKDFPSTKTIRLLKEYFNSHPHFLRVISFKKSIQNYFSVLKKQDPFWAEVKFLKLSISKASSDEVDGLNIRFPRIGLNKWVQKNKNKELGVWNVFSAKQIQRAHQLKIKFITTDDPLLCLETLP